MLKVNEVNNNAHIPTQVRAIINAVIEEAKAHPKGKLLVHHRQDFQVTEFLFADDAITPLADPQYSAVSARLSHSIYPEETLVVSYEDRRNPKVAPPSEKILRDTPMASYDTKTRHYQPSRYLGKTAGISNSSMYATDVSRLDEANIAVDIFNFIHTGNAPA